MRKILILLVLSTGLLSCDKGIEDLFASGRKSKSDKNSSSDNSKDKNDNKGGVYAKDLIGKINDSQIESIAAAKLVGKLSTERIDFRTLKSKTIFSDHIRSLKADKITGRVPADHIEWDLSKISRVKLSAENIGSGQFDIERIPMIGSNKIETLTLGNLPNITDEKIESVSTSKLIGSINTEKLEGTIKTNTLEGVVSKNNLPEISIIKGKLKADKIAGTIDQKNIPNISTKKLIYGNGTKGHGTIKLFSPESPEDSELASVMEYSWYRVGEIVHLSFMLDKDESGNDSSFDVNLPLGDIPVPTKSMFSRCRTLSGVQFKDFAYGTASIISNEVIDVPSKILILTTSNLGDCPNDDSKIKKFRLFSPSFPKNSRLAGQISYISRVP